MSYWRFLVTINVTDLNHRKQRRKAYLLKYLCRFKVTKKVTFQALCIFHANTTKYGKAFYFKGLGLFGTLLRKHGIANALEGVTSGRVKRAFCSRLFGRV